MAAQDQQVAGDGALPLHAVWWQVLKPRMVTLPNGQPAYDLVHTCETLAEATMHLRPIPGGVIVQNTVVFINPKANLGPLAKPS
jgi:hypothetical protein